ncbi:MAG: hypothetical protein ACF788_11715 [Novipirellula sp. JB048]
MQVEINGQPTRQQTLGGIHKNSRIFTLTSLSKKHYSPCKIVVFDYDEMGDPTQYHYNLQVQVGGHYEVAYPQGFERFSEIVPIGPLFP